MARRKVYVNRHPRRAYPRMDGTKVAATIVHDYTKRIEDLKTKAEAIQLREKVKREYIETQKKMNELKEQKRKAEQAEDLERSRRLELLERQHSNALGALKMIGGGIRGVGKGVYGFSKEVAEEQQREKEREEEREKESEAKLKEIKKEEREEETFKMRQRKEKREVRTQKERDLLSLVSGGRMTPEQLKETNPKVYAKYYGKKEEKTISPSDIKRNENVFVKAS